MAKKKVIKQRQDTGGRPGFGSFLARLAADPFPMLPEAAPPSPDVKVAWQSVSLPKKVAALEKEMAALKKAIKPTRKCALWKYVSAVKKKYPDRASDQQFISQCVDAMLGRDKRGLGDVCPKSWRKVCDLPDLLQFALRHASLKGRVKTFISKASKFPEFPRC